MAAKIKIDNLSKTIDGVEIFKKLSFEVNSREFIVAVGDSGAGKTTLLRLIAGLTQPDSGIILVDGINIAARSTRKIEARMMFQEGVLFDHLSVRQNAYLALKNNLLNTVIDNEKKVSMLARKL